MSAAASNRLVDPIGSLDADLGDWREVVNAWLASAEGQALLAFVEQRQRGGAVVYPRQVFRALEMTPLAGTRVVILGQDPYHGAEQAEGLAFSVPAGVRIPPSLRNIFAELRRDLGLTPPLSGHLGGWARQGVLLLNTSLTVEDGAAASHAKRGWEALTDRLLRAAAADSAPKVFMLWGAHAQAREGLIEPNHAEHLVLCSNHPSPLSATRGPLPFIGCGHFSRAIEFLRARSPGQPALDWSQSA